MRMPTIQNRSLTRYLSLSAFVAIIGTSSFSVFAQSENNAIGDGVFEVLASEIALQRGEPGLAYKTYLSMARQTLDPRLAQRAMEIAIAAGAPDLALEAAKTWSNLSDPSQTTPKEILITLLMLNQRWPEAVQPAIALLSQQSLSVRDQTLQQWQPLLARATDETAAMRAYFDIVSALKPPPKESNVLYTYALSAEKLGKYEVMERTLKSILAKNPSDVNTLNALGYSLADRNQKLPEAFELISKAHRLAPQDSFILDSLGWVNFRMGSITLAIEQLSEAFNTKPEADIAAHLGEVLWSQNKNTEAEAVWRKGELIDANNSTLKETLMRLEPKWLEINGISKTLWDGRFAVKITGITDSQNQGGSGGFTLIQDKLKDTLEIRNPVGGSIAKITVSPGEATLERDGKLIKAIDADALIRDALGLPLPARGLSDWLRGQVRPGSPASLERDPNGQVNKIIQDGWNLSYIWNEANKLEKLNMTRNSNTGSIDIRLVFDNLND